MCKLGRHGYVCIWGSHRGKLGPRKIKAHEMEDVLKDATRERTPRRPGLGRKAAQAQVRKGWEWTGNPCQGAWESRKPEKGVPAVTARHTGPVEGNGCRQEIGEKRRENFRWSLEPGIAPLPKGSESLCGQNRKRTGWHMVLQYLWLSHQS